MNLKKSCLPGKLSLNSSLYSRGFIFFKGIPNGASYAVRTQSQNAAPASRSLSLTGHGKRKSATWKMSRQGTWASRLDGQSWAAAPDEGCAEVTIPMRSCFHHVQHFLGSPLLRAALLCLGDSRAQKQLWSINSRDVDIKSHFNVWIKRLKRIR